MIDRNWYVTRLIDALDLCSNCDISYCPMKARQNTETMRSAGLNPLGEITPTDQSSMFTSIFSCSRSPPSHSPRNQGCIFNFMGEVNGEMQVKWNLNDIGGRSNLCGHFIEGSYEYLYWIPFHLLLRRRA